MPRPAKAHSAPADTGGTAVIADEREYPSVSIRQRRIAQGSPNTRKLVKITLHGQPEPMRLRSFNCAQAGRYDEARNLGWEPITPDEVAGGIFDGGDVFAKGNRVVSGEHGAEVWMKMPEKDYTDIAKAKADRLNKQQQSRSAMKAAVTQSMERDAKDASKADALDLERQAETTQRGIEIDTFTVSRERMAID